MAVAGIIAAPMAVQADGSLYASARVGFSHTSTGDADEFEATSDDFATVDITEEEGSDQMAIGSWASRFGAKGETDLGNGMTGFGKY